METFFCRRIGKKPLGTGRFLLCMAFLLPHAGLARGEASSARATFDIQSAPTPADWRYFIRASEKDREKLWNSHASRGIKLGDWAWGWRLGWVRTCDGSERPFCQKIRNVALFDRALVVRAEAATRLGRRREGSGDKGALALLAQSFTKTDNARHGQPLYIQNRILFAIFRIGGDDALRLGERLAAKHRDTKAYWKTLATSQG